MDVEVVGFARMILNRPVLDRSNLSNNGRRIIYVKHARLVAGQGDKELAGSVAAAELF